MTSYSGKNKFLRRSLFLMFACFLILPCTSWDRFVFGNAHSGKELVAYRFGTGGICLVIVGGVHGAYEGNTIQISHQLIDYWSYHENELSISLYIIENLNPDGFSSSWKDPKTRKDASFIRFNQAMVDLNRNWDTPDWKTDVVYNENDVRPGAGGPSPMSEPEVQAFSDLLLGMKDSYALCAVIMLHAYVFQNVEIGAAFPSYIYTVGQKSESDHFAEEMARILCAPGEYSQHSEWDVYEVPGEFLQWAGLHGIPAVDLELGGLRNVLLPREHGRPSHWDSFRTSLMGLLKRMSEFGP